MCLAILKPANKKVPNDHLRNGFIGNSHGAGFAFSQNGELIIRKGFFALQDFMEAYEEVPDECPALVHFRLATHGAKDKANCHPFVIREARDKTPTMALIHNGIINGYGDSKREGSFMSDTAQFCHDFTKPILNAIPEKLVSFEALKRAIADKTTGNYDALPQTVKTTIAIAKAIHSESNGAKLCILDRRGEHFIFGERQGTWDDGIWYSNSGYCGYRSQRNHRMFEWEHDLEGHANNMHQDLTPEELEAMREFDASVKVS